MENATIYSKTDHDVTFMRMKEDAMHHDRDENAAVNIRDKGKEIFLTVLCGAVRGKRKGNCVIGMS